MNIYIITALSAIGVLSRMSYYQSLQVVSNIALQIKEFETASKEDIKRNILGVIIGTLLLVSSLVYMIIYYRNWSSLLYLIISGIISLIILKIVRAIIGGYNSRILFIWILPILGSIYFIYKVI